MYFILNTNATLKNHIKSNFKDKNKFIVIYYNMYVLYNLLQKTSVS